MIICSRQSHLDELESDELEAALLEAANDLANKASVHSAGDGPFVSQPEPGPVETRTASKYNSPLDAVRPATKAGRKKREKIIHEPKDPGARHSRQGQ